MSKRIVAGKPEYIIKQLLNVSTKLLGFKLTEETLSDHIGIEISRTKQKLTLYPLSYEGGEILDCYLGSQMCY